MGEEYSIGAVRYNGFCVVAKAYGSKREIEVLGYVLTDSPLEALGREGEMPEINGLDNYFDRSELSSKFRRLFEFPNRAKVIFKK